MKAAPAPNQDGLPGVSLEVTRPSKKKKGKSRPKTKMARVRASYGEIVPLPTDRKRLDLSIGPFRVLRKTTGEYCLFDYRRPLGQGEIPGTGPTLHAAVVALVKWGKTLSVIVAALALACGPNHTPRDGSHPDRWYERSACGSGWVETTCDAGGCFTRPEPLHKPSPTGPTSS